MYFMVQIMVQIKVPITRGVNPGAINSEITTTLPEKACVFITLIGFPGVSEKFLAVDHNYLFTKVFQTHKRFGL
jgi:hypothetical protein